LGESLYILYRGFAKTNHRRIVMPGKNEQAASDSDQPSRWEVLARERNSRVILCHTPDTYLLTDLAKSADRAIRALRDRIYTTLKPEDVGPLFEEYNEATLKLHEVIEKISEKVDIQYRPPRTIRIMLGLDEKEGKNGDEPDPVSSKSKTKSS
jgi:hypothetical protein